jgi:hypothetical protein
MDCPRTLLMSLASLGLIALLALVAPAADLPATAPAPTTTPAPTTGPAPAARADALSALARGEFAGDTDFARWLNAQADILRRAGENLAFYRQQGLEPASVVIADIERDAANQGLAIDETITLKRRAIELQRTPQQTYNVRDFGAKGDGSADDGPAIRQAITAAMGTPGARVYLPTGTYRVAATDPVAIAAASPFFEGMERGPGVAQSDLKANAPCHLFIDGAADLTIAGDGADKTLILWGEKWAGGFGILRSRNLVIRDLAMDFAPLPFTQGSVTAIVDDRSYEVAVDEGFPSPLDEHIRNARGLVTRNFVRSDEGILPLREKYDPTFFTLGDIQKLEDRRYRFTLGPSMMHRSSAGGVAALKPGDLFVLYGRVSNSCSAVVFDGVKNGSLQGVNIYSSYAAAVLTKRSGLIEIGRCKVMPKPGAGRIASTNADGLFVQMNYLAPYLHDTLMTLGGDDFINTPSDALSIERYEGSTFHGKMHGHTQFKPGQSLLAVEAGTYRRKYQGTIAKTTVQRGPDGALMIAIEMRDPIPSGLLVSTQSESQGQKPDRLLNLDTLSPGLVVLDNQLVYGFRMIVRSPNALIAGNRIVNRHYPGHFILFGLHPSEAWTAQNLTFRGNTIDSLGTIVHAPQVPVNYPQLDEPNRDIFFEGNTIVNPEVRSDAELFDGTLFSRKWSQHVILQNNTYRAAESKP